MSHLAMWETLSEGQEGPETQWGAMSTTGNPGTS